MNKSLEELKIEEILENSKGHWVDYEWIDEDGSKGVSKAIPISFYEHWLKIALNSSLAQYKREMKRRIKKLKPKEHTDHRNKDEWYACVTCMEENNIEDTINLVLAELEK